MRFWWLSVAAWHMALCLWFQELAVLVLARSETDYADWKLFLLIFIWLFVVFSFFHVIFKPPASIPKEFVCSSEEAVKKAKKFATSEVKYCDSCRILKPERAHHCRTCQRCVLRMDHHCPLLQICIHHGNQKFYILYLIWPCILGLYAVYLCSANVHRNILSAWSTSHEPPTEDQLIISAFVNAITIIGAMIYLLWTQVPNLLKNVTIIEEARGISYTTNCWTRNVHSVMGPLWSWLLPVDTVPGNGIDFGTSAE